jgi:glycosyltransferase involved in cell wall biosynthesis
MDMSQEDNTSGVDRYINTLLFGLEAYPAIRVFRIQFVSGRLFLHREETKPNYIHVVIPLPQHINEIINEQYWMRKYNELALEKIRHLFVNKTNRILHIHTINLIALATFIRNKFYCKIITHLHCIPWKDFYNNNRKRYNNLYYQYYIAPNMPISKVMQIPRKHIAIIYNGINDISNNDTKDTRKFGTKAFRGLFVGTMTESKGVLYIAEALQKLHNKGYKVSIDMAGMCTSAMRKKIETKHPDLSINIHGRISFEELKVLYQTSNFGIIASLHEQCSYVAIEMAVFGLPIITTAVDGLDEIFTESVNALKVDTRFSKVYGLSVDTDMMAERIVRLNNNPDLCHRLCNNVRRLYLQKFTLKDMIQKTIKIYMEVVNG